MDVGTNLTALCSGERHCRLDLAEDRADAISHTRHNRTGRYRDKSCHQGVFDQILSTIVFPNPLEQLNKQ
jgi:hypothetical protein